jgi:hypothetical protein
VNGPEQRCHREEFSARDDEDLPTGGERHAWFPLPGMAPPDLPLYASPLLPGISRTNLENFQI